MKIKLLLFAVFVAAIICSCEKDSDSVYTDDYIIAGQVSGNGIDYHDPDPDLSCTLSDPWNKTDTVIYLDLNSDGITDFNIHGSMLHPSALGGDWESVTITPLNTNEICIDLNSGWLDTVPKNDTINQHRTWSDSTALIYSYSWMMGEPSETNGLWINVTTENTYYIGVMVYKNEIPYYGWIGMIRDATSFSFSYQISDYCILKPYTL
jgi:hypothetical protein